MKIELSKEIVKACREYNEGLPGFNDIGKLNRVAFLGERLCALVAHEDKKKRDSK